MQPGYYPHLLLAYLMLNAAVFLVYWWDKRAARRNEWRIRESTLLLLAFAGGGAGALAAQRLLRHKTRKPPFNVALPFFFILQLACLFAVIAAPDGLVALLRHWSMDS
ncbi:Uncharacterized membrane protein YsdA, DUF1294 family [Rhizobium sp. NFR07]|uniref:DUF1294 domain-containing protein n=1 Tax=Rhizobium sp. NFR07 TaxID=1566262 RepID=UPI0008E7AA88|nr:DUF1294 domain-containing protein [Rhizobium sp. NFR07]SFB61138.1 Uncharacterized membrane protein YsdA, DUF1294 family [Rhizobium sp. NFR07]